MQLDPNDPLLKLASAIPWQEFEAMTVGNFLALFLMAKAANLSDFLMEI